MTRDPLSKIKSEEELAKIIADLRSQGKIVGFTNGAFDILHAGHVRYLNDAKKNCDYLVLALNSDASVKLYKGEKRPIVPQQERAELIAALECIDYVVIFDDRRVRRLLGVLKPSLYIKGGDYTIEQLTSRDVVEQYGGKALILPLVKGQSTTNIIKKVIAVEGAENADQLKDETLVASTEKRDPAKAVFIDRDGTINEEVEYLHEPEKFKLLPNAATGIKKMQDMGYKIIVVTTQAGIGLGYFTKEDFYKVNKVMLKELSAAGIVLDKIYFCPHSVKDNCDCRKPKTGLLERARTELDIDFRQCYIIGDKTSDLQAGVNAGIKPIAVKTGHGCKDTQCDATPVYEAEDLLDAANFIEKNSNQESNQENECAEDK